MNYIIDPRVFYWMSVISNIKMICVVLFIVSIIGFILCIAFCADGLFCDEDAERKCKIAMKILAVATILFMLGIIFIPSKTTMTEMLIAKYATAENAELGIDAIKSAVDYIVNAMQSVK